MLHVLGELGKRVTVYDPSTSSNSSLSHPIEVECSPRKLNYSSLMEIKNRVVSYLLTWHPRMLDVPALDAWYKLVGDGALTYGESLKQKQCWYFEKYYIKTKLTLNWWRTTVHRHLKWCVYSTGTIAASHISFTLPKFLVWLVPTNLGPNIHVSSERNYWFRPVKRHTPHALWAIGWDVSELQS